MRFICLAIFLIATITAPNAAESDLPDTPYLLIDSQKREVLADNRAFERWHPASLTKLMTTYVTLKAIEAGEIEPGSPVTITKTARRAPPSRMNYPAGTRLRFDTALTILIVKSANDVAIAIAESLAGSVPAFVSRMNAAARELGMTDSNFTNPNGLHDPNQYSSARDLTLLADAIWQGFPAYREMFAIAAIRAGEKVHYAYNLLLERFAGADGMKTGFVCASGYNIVASASRKGRRLVAVVLGAASQSERAEIAARLLSKGFETVKGTPLAGLPRPATVSGPANMRPVLCSEAARKARYDPAPQFAVIESDYLAPRTVTREPIVVTPGGIDGEPSPAFLARAFMPERVPMPARRPDYVVVDVNGEIVTDFPVSGAVAVPTPNPLIR